MSSSTKNNINTNFVSDQLTISSSSFKISADLNNLKFFDSENSLGRSLTNLVAEDADISSSFVVVQTTSSLPNKRLLLTGSSAVTITDNGAGNTLVLNANLNSLQVITSTWVPDLLIWEDTGINAPMRGCGILRISDKLYAFGGVLSGTANTGTNKIYSASYIENPVFTDTGSVLPEIVDGPRLCVIDDKLFIFGHDDSVKGTTGGRGIHSASVSAPLTWNYSGVLTPAGQRDNAPLVLTDNHIYVINGYTSTSTFITASINSPLSWTTLAIGATWECSAAVIGPYIYRFGGVAANTFVPKGAANSNPLAFSATNLAALPVAVENVTEVYHSGDEIFLIGAGGAAGGRHVLSTKVGAEHLGWNYYNTILPEATLYTRGAIWVGPDGRLYFIVRYPGTNCRMYRSGRKLVNVDYATDSTDPYAGLIGTYAEGNTPAQVSKYVRLGFKPWIYHRTGTI